MAAAKHLPRTRRPWPGTSCWTSRRGSRGVMVDHGGRSAMVRAICDGGRMVVAGNLYIQGGGMGTPTAVLEFREELDDE